MAKEKSGTDTPGGRTGKRAARLEDDAALWARVAETATPLTDKNRVTHVAPPRTPAPRPAPKDRAARVVSSPPAAAKPGAPAIAKKSPPSKTSLDRQTARKLDKGHLAVEARLDLHGMRQREAHGALRTFLHWARAKDYRHVLVITGKGSGGEASSFYEEDTRGVLRQAVPHWLTHGDLAPLIVSVAQAPRRLGGEGALYVRLRRSKAGGG